MKTFEHIGDVYIFLILPKYLLFFHLVLPFRGYRRQLHVSQKTKKSKIDHDLEIQKVSPQKQLCFFLLVCLAEPSIEQTKQALGNKKDGKIKIKAYCLVF